MQAATVTKSKEVNVEKKDTIKLIEGHYTPGEAAEILFSVLSDKIRFHNIQILSIKERFNGDTAHSENRVKELRAAQEKVEELIKEARDNGYKFRIKSDISISLYK
ncbi:hypothetical protein [Robertkochia aurantiaca]|uniref:hypothetical protein n=1 Tax=Robertkochia aurantiaca TaxID=2873700 RepID=UPI001CC9DF62|nr:hypothetical protein [Robertkochia sp. 3YJGBD-33]